MPCSVCVISGRSATGDAARRRDVDPAVDRDPGRKTADFNGDDPRVPVENAEARAAPGRAAAGARAQDARGARHRRRAGAAARAGAERPTERIAISVRSIFKMSRWGGL